MTCTSVHSFDFYTNLTVVEHLFEFKRSISWEKMRGISEEENDAHELRIHYTRHLLFFTHWYSNCFAPLPFPVVTPPAFIRLMYGPSLLHVVCCTLYKHGSPILLSTCNWVATNKSQRNSSRNCACGNV